MLKKSLHVVQYFVLTQRNFFYQIKMSICSNVTPKLTQLSLFFKTNFFVKLSTPNGVNFNPTNSKFDHFLLRSDRLLPN